MRELRTNITVVLLISLGILYSGCNNSRRLLHGKPLKNRTPSAIIKKNQETNFNFDYLGMKMAIDFSHAEGKESFKANIKIKKDSIIWISISPALGIEVIRMVITPDSVKLISKIPKNKYYYEGDFSVINDQANMDLTFGMIQDILVGNPIMLDKQDDKFISQVSSNNYALISRFNRKLKRILKYDERKLYANDEIKIDPSHKTYIKVKRKAKMDELLVKRFWIDGYNYHLKKALYNDFYNFRHVTIDYEDFKEVGEQKYPSRGKIRVDMPEKWQEFVYKISRIRVGKKYKFPYVVPEGFEKRENI